MSQKNVVLVANDAAPSRAFVKLATVLEKRGIVVKLFAGDGKPIKEPDEEIVRAISQAGLVLLGMSSSREFAAKEIMAGEKASELGIVYGFYGDIVKCWARARQGAWFEKLARNAAFYLGVSVEDANAARDVFPNAKLFGTGNPLREEMAFPRLTREEVRSKLKIRPDEKVLLASGAKFTGGNMAMLAIVMDALKILTDDREHFQLIITKHPGDRTPFAVDLSTKNKLDLYERMIEFSPVPARIIERDFMTTSDIIPGADIIVDAGISAGMEGAYQRIPVINLGLEIFLKQFEIESGTRVSELVGNGLSELVDADAKAFANVIKRLLTPDGYAAMKACHEKYCPKPARMGIALDNMADAIEKFLLK